MEVFRAGANVNSLVLSLFPGIGLLDMAFETEGWCVVRGPDVLWGGDIRRFHPPPGKFVGVIGGPPCQTFSSLAHLVRHNGFEPKFGNLIPEFERCVLEAAPEWFLMENVRAAPLPAVPGYQMHAFLLDNAWIDDGTGRGQEQMRVRRFCFGWMRDAIPPDLRRWIDLAALLLPELHEAVTGGHDKPPSRRIGNGKRQYRAVCSKFSEVPVKIGGSGKVKATYRQATVISSNGGPTLRMARYTLAEACRLQGLPEDFLADAPFTKEGKLKAIANGISLFTGRAIAKAIRCALEESLK